MNTLALFLRGLRTDWRRYLNRKMREKRVVYTWDRWEHTRAVQANRWRLWQP